MPTLSEDEARILAYTVVGEAAGEPYQGKVAVAAVLQNRVNDSRFPNSPIAVATQGNSSGYHQFSAWNAPSKGGNTLAAQYPETSQTYKSALAAVQDVFGGKVADPTNGATHYVSTSVATPYWWSAEAPKGGVTIGGHIFAQKKSAPVTVAIAPTLVPDRIARPEVIAPIPASVDRRVTARNEYAYNQAQVSDIAAKAREALAPPTAQTAPQPATFEQKQTARANAVVPDWTPFLGTPLDFGPPPQGTGAAALTQLGLSPYIDRTVADPFPTGFPEPGTANRALNQLGLVSDQQLTAQIIQENRATSRQITEARVSAFQNVVSDPNNSIYTAGAMASAQAAQSYVPQYITEKVSVQVPITVAGVNQMYAKGLSPSDPTYKAMQALGMTPQPRALTTDASKVVLRTVEKTVTRVNPAYVQQQGLKVQPTIAVAPVRAAPERRYNPELNQWITVGKPPAPVQTPGNTPIDLVNGDSGSSDSGPRADGRNNLTGFDGWLQDVFAGPDNPSPGGRGTNSYNPDTNSWSPK